MLPRGVMSSTRQLPSFPWRSARGLPFMPQAVRFSVDHHAQALPPLHLIRDAARRRTFAILKRSHDHTSSLTLLPQLARGVGGCGKHRH